MPLSGLSAVPIRPCARLAPHIGLITRSALFAGLSETDYEVLARTARTRTLDRRQCLFKQDEPVRNLFCSKTELKFTQLSASGSEAILWLIGPGQVGASGYAVSDEIYLLGMVDHRLQGSLLGLDAIGVLHSR